MQAWLAEHFDSLPNFRFFLSQAAAVGRDAKQSRRELQASESEAFERSEVYAWRPYILSLSTLILSHNNNTPHERDEDAMLNNALTIHPPCQL